MASELEVLAQAKKYIDALAQGFNPLTGEEMPDDELLNNARLVRCFFYISGVLQKVIDNGGELAVPAKYSKHKKNLPPFAITEEQKANVIIEDEPIFISGIVRNIINAVPESDSMCSLKASAFTAFLMQDGYLKIETYADKTGKEKSRKIPTPSGERIGLSTKWIESTHGQFLGTLYSAEAQRFLFENLDEIIAISNGEIKPEY